MSSKTEAMTAEIHSWLLSFPHTRPYEIVKAADAVVIIAIKIEVMHIKQRRVRSPCNRAMVFLNNRMRTCKGKRIRLAWILTIACLAENFSGPRLIFWGDCAPQE